MGVQWSEERVAVAVVSASMLSSFATLCLVHSQQAQQTPPLESHKRPEPPELSVQPVLPAPATPTRAPPSAESETRIATPSSQKDTTPPSEPASPGIQEPEPDDEHEAEPEAETQESESLTIAPGLKEALKVNLRRRSYVPETMDNPLDNFLIKHMAGRKPTKSVKRRAIHFALVDHLSTAYSSQKNAIRLLKQLAIRLGDHMEDLDAATLLYTLDVLQKPAEHVPLALRGKAEDERYSWLLNTFTRGRPEDSIEQALFAEPDFALESPRSSVKLSNEKLTCLPYDAGPIETQGIMVVLERSTRWGFDVRKLKQVTKGKELQTMGWHLLHNYYGLVEKFELNGKALRRWLGAMEMKYTDTEYHNATHACDVLQTVHFFISQAGARQYFNDTHILALLLSAIVHDLGHDGKNNAFHKATVFHNNGVTPIAVRHNDTAIQENFHISTVFEETLREPKINIFKDMDNDLRNQVRRLMIVLVLSTDMSQHFERLAFFESLIESKGCDPTNWEDAGSKEALMCGVLHCADISNPAKPRILAHHWADLCLAEFFKQGAMEKRLGLPISFNCDREKTKLHQSQIGFINYIVLPCFDNLATLLPQVKTTCLPVLQENLQHWKSVGEEYKNES